MPPPAVFQVEKWMDDHEKQAKYQLAETCCQSISIKQLIALCQPQLDLSAIIDSDTPQTYGDIRGLQSLRSNFASLYSAKKPGTTADHILITPGAISANFLSFYALLSPGDHVVCQWPTYQQLYDVPESLGCHVSLWKPKYVDGRSWEWDPEDLKALMNEETKMIILNNPNNPTGAILGKNVLLQIVEIASATNTIIHSDEVYRPIFHSINIMDQNFPPSIISMNYEKSIVVGSMSKAYSLAGIRVGWIGSRDTTLVEKLAAARHYLTISVSMLDQQIASLATSHICLHALLARNISLAKTNVALLETFIRDHSSITEWVRPVAGTTAFVQFRKDGRAVDDVAFCERLQEETGVMLLPGSRGFGGDVVFKGFVRIGFANETGILKEGLERIRSFLRGKTWAEIETVTG